MSRLVVEVLQSKIDAESRANFYQQLGCKVQPVQNYRDVVWINKTLAGNSDTASDPLDNEVWIVLASK